MGRSGIQRGRAPFWFLCAVGAACVIAPYALADDKRGGCTLLKPLEHSHAGLLSTVDRDRMERIRQRHCRTMNFKKEGESTAKYRNAVLIVYSTRAALCTGPGAKPSLKKRFPRSDFESLLEVYDKYCRDSYDPNGKEFDAKLTDSPMRLYLWLKKEEFCQVTRAVAFPETWESAFEPRDLHSVTRLQNQTLQLCDMLRNNKLSQNEAVYRWEQEFRWFQKGVKREILQQTVQSMKDTLYEAFKKVINKMK